jgi:hypothetical protein
MKLLGMMLYSFKYEAGVVERSMRRVKVVFKPGELHKEQNREWKGMDEELVTRLARMALSPWSDWEEVKVKKEGEGVGIPFDCR